MKLFFLGVALFVGAALSQGLYADGILGQKNYEAKCKSCHGKAGEGNPALAKALKVDSVLLPLAKKLEKSDEELAILIRDGKEKMPAFKTKFSDDQIKELVAYIRSFSKE